MNNLHWTLIVIFWSLAAIHSIYFVLKRRNRAKDYSVWSQRLWTWWGMWLILCLATLFNPIVSLLGIMLLSFFALKEYFSMIRSRKAERRLYLWAYLSIPAQFYWIYIEWYGMFIIFIPVYVFLFLPLPRIVNKGTAGFLRSVSRVQWGLMLMVFGLSHLAYFPFATPQYGAGLVLLLVVLTQLNDIVHYLASYYIGKHKIAPTANPYLTWEGFIVAMLSTTGAAYLLAPFFTPLDASFGLFAGSLIGLGGFIGSLTVSVLKRDLRIGQEDQVNHPRKIYLNLVDSLTYTSPVFFHVTRYFFDFM
ncbi:phosphatidate cytidylyltransferase [Paenibacillus senegalimassiliensis]|uniref:phosphatidate cytidylyltransferase n=1 Tax=Paenibacillus senegalimassiliensis TaxID=1737426 RepID=UPI00073E35B8|nr:phosphatidate cytidylyltransferase [Paenibacillus senegalimassiliensis]